MKSSGDFRTRAFRRSVDSTALSQGLWATACWLISAIRGLMKTMPNARSERDSAVVDVISQLMLPPRRD